MDGICKLGTQVKYRFETKKKNNHVFLGKGMNMSNGFVYYRKNKKGKDRSQYIEKLVL